MIQAEVIVIGAGGHGLVVADALLAAGSRVLGFVDADPRLADARLLDLPVLGDDSVLAQHCPGSVLLANGIGGTGHHAAAGLRASVQRRLEAGGWTFATVIHPTAIVSAHARIATGAQLLAGCVVQPCASIGHGAIVNTRAVVEHDTQVGDFAHVAPGAVLCGNVHVGAGTHVGAGATLRQGVRLGEAVVVGIGAAVLRDVDMGTVAGVPAKQQVRQA